MESENSKMFLKKIAVISSFIFVSIFTGCLFPIINFNLENPVNIGVPMRGVMVLTAFWLMNSTGYLEAYVFKNVNNLKVILLNLAIAGFGLIFRYVLEFGEVSNTYNFTFTNLMFHILLLVCVTSFIYLKRKDK